MDGNDKLLIGIIIIIVVILSIILKIHFKNVKKQNINSEEKKYIYTSNSITLITLITIPFIVSALKGTIEELKSGILLIFLYIIIFLFGGIISSIISKIINFVSKNKDNIRINLVNNITAIIVFILISLYFL